MNEPAKKWVAALRSGEFEQGFGKLRKNNTYCCLGVLCELAVKAGIIPPAVEIKDKLGFRNDGIFTYGGSVCILPEKVASWVGLRTRGGATRDLNRSLVTENDSGSTFVLLADFIESESSGLFT